MTYQNSSIILKKPNTVTTNERQPTNQRSRILRPFPLIPIRLVISLREQGLLISSVCYRSLIFPLVSITEHLPSSPLSTGPDLPHLSVLSWVRESPPQTFLPPPGGRPPNWPSSVSPCVSLGGRFLLSLWFGSSSGGPWCPQHCLE